MVWNQIFNICESCLYLLLLLQGICSPVSHVALLSLPLDSGWPLLTTKYKIVISSFFPHPPCLLCFTPNVMLFTYSTLTFLCVSCLPVQVCKLLEGRDYLLCLSHAPVPAQGRQTEGISTYLLSGCLNRVGADVLPPGQIASHPKVRSHRDEFLSGIC